MCVNKFIECGNETITYSTLVLEKVRFWSCLMKTLFQNIDEFHDGSENMNEDDVSDESTDVAEEDWAGLD